MWNGVGRFSEMVNDDSTQKGMKTVLEERGINTSGMNAAKMREKLQTFQASHVIPMIPMI